MRQIATTEGPGALWKGLAPALLRQVSYTSLALVLYEPIRNAIKPGQGEASFGQRLLAGGTAGALSISVFNPAEVLKTQIQTSVSSRSMRTVMSSVYREGGVISFWAGVGPNVVRTFLVNAAELGTYDEAKTRLIPLVGDNACAHIGASGEPADGRGSSGDPLDMPSHAACCRLTASPGVTGIAGIASACVSTPADVIKTRLMNAAGGKREYSGVLDALVTILRHEGPQSLYKGFVPIVVRKILWCSIFFVSYEKLRSAVGA